MIMVVSILFNKIKHFVFLIVGIFRRALCCFRRRRRSSFDSAPLTHVRVGQEAEESWQWDDNISNAEPKSIQDHIELYRKRKRDVQQACNDQAIHEEDESFFNDMAPKITRQTKVLIDTGEDSQSVAQSRLNLIEATSMETGELREWVDGAVGWEGETLDWDAQEALREKKRQDRERKIWEQQQKRQEKHNRALGARLT